MKNLLPFFGFVFLLSVIAFNVYNLHHMTTDEYYKDLVIKHSDDIVATGKDVNYDNHKDKVHYKINELDHYYYEEVTIVRTGDNYRIILWGNRDSWLWGFRTDKSIEVDIPYNRYKGKDVTKDLLIIDILKNRDFELEERNKDVKKQRTKS